MIMIDQKIHNMINCISIPIIVMLTIFGLISQSSYLLHINVIYAFVYVIFDTCIILKYPFCVTGRNSLLFHHITTLIHLLYPVFGMQYLNIAAVALLVEINTLLLVIKKYYKHPMIKKMFYLTWVIFRLIGYPILFLFLMNGYISKDHDTMYLISTLAQFCLCILNYKWTIDILNIYFTKH